MELQDLVTEVNYVLTTPFEYAQGGDTPAASFILLKAPTTRHLKECAALEQSFRRAHAALVKDQEQSLNLNQDQNTSTKDDSKTETEITGDDILGLMSASMDVDFPEVLGVARKLFLNPGVAFIEGETQLKQVLMERISLLDLKGMLGTYLVNFTIAASLETTNA